MGRRSPAARSAFLAAALSAFAAAQTVTGPQLATFHSSVDDSDQPYGLYVPKSFDPSKTYPLVISLHEEDSNHRMNLRRIFGVVNRIGDTDTENMRFFPQVKDVPFLVATPYARGTMGYQGIAEKDVYDVLADVERRFPVDRDRVYLTGISMGGAGALWLAMTRPDVWAAVAPLCPTDMPGAEELAGNALNVPIRLFHGDQDPINPVAGSRAWQRRLIDLGVPAEYMEFPGTRHNAWDMAYRDGAIFDWFSRFHRVRVPERVRLVTRSYRYASAYWLRIDGLTPGSAASIDARWRNPTALEVTTSGVDAFTVTMERASQSMVTVTIDGVALRAKAAASLSFLRAGGRWREGKFPPAAKRPGAEGPIAVAVEGRHIYVYGTGGAPSADELGARRQVAEKAAAWSTVRQRLSLNLPVKADSAVTQADLDSADVVLFGTAATNMLIARFAASLPLALSPAAADYGLLFIAPIGRHYALVSSGLPWWTGADEAKRGGYTLAPSQYRLLSTFGDYILFKGSLAGVVAEGRFDNAWKVASDQARALASPGIVTVR